LTGKRLKDGHLRVFGCLRKRFELTPILSKAITLRLSQFGT
jgi:hypothetical protein